jgi:predicted nucleic acid-binding protein
MADGTVSGQPRSALDMVVASIAEANHCVIVTNNEKHFRSVAQMVNPMQQSH